MIDPIKNYEEIIRIFDSMGTGEKVSEWIKSADSCGYSYEQIYTAMHKMIDLALYEYEIEKAL